MSLRDLLRGRRVPHNPKAGILRELRKHDRQLEEQRRIFEEGEEAVRAVETCVTAMEALEAAGVPQPELAFAREQVQTGRAELEKHKRVRQIYMDAREALNAQLR